MDRSEECLAEATRLFSQWLSGSASHRAFLIAHETRHAKLRVALADSFNAYNLASVDELQVNYDRLVDSAHVEEAVGWHKAICEILLRERAALSGLKSEPDYYVCAHALLEDRIAHHIVLMRRLCGEAIVG